MGLPTCRWSTLAAILPVTLAGMMCLPPASVQADEGAVDRFKTICSSSNGPRETCHFGFEAAEVRMSAQRSTAACIRDSTWRSTSRSVTVEGGCAAEFEVTMKAKRPRVIVLTDIGQDPDDVQSLIRTMLYANDVSIKGIVPTYRPGDRPVGSDLVRLVIKAYAKDVRVLRQHDIRYPEPHQLKSLLKHGLPTNEQIGAGYDSPGSNHIVRVVEASEDPVWILVWGGSRELAQAVHKVRSTRSPKRFGDFIKKLRVYAIGWSQYSPEPAEYLSANAKEMFWISSSSYDGGKNGTFRGMYMLGDRSMQGREWNEKFILSRGHLGKLYPLNTTEGGLKEGDTPSLLHILPIGLNDPERPDEGGWGGRYEREKDYSQITKQFFSSRYVEDWLDGTRDRRASVARWRPAFQADFAARAAWLDLSYDEANHPPEPRISGETSRTLRSGEKLVLDASSSSDPDGDALSYRWWVYEEAGNFEGDLPIAGADGAIAELTAPEVGETKEVALILEVRDSGEPALTRYQRVRLRIEPE